MFGPWPYPLPKDQCSHAKSVHTEFYAGLEEGESATCMWIISTRYFPPSLLTDYQLVLSHKGLFWWHISEERKREGRISNEKITEVSMVRGEHGNISQNMLDPNASAWNRVLPQANHVYCWWSPADWNGKSTWLPLLPSPPTSNPCFKSPCASSASQDTLPSPHPPPKKTSIWKSDILIYTKLCSFQKQRDKIHVYELYSKPGAPLVLQRAKAPGGLILIRIVEHGDREVNPFCPTSSLPKTISYNLYLLQNQLYSSYNV